MLEIEQISKLNVLFSLLCEWHCAGGFATGLYAAKSVVHTVVSSIGMARNCLAVGQIEVKLGEIPEGKSAVFEWRGKPVFVRHRTSAEIATEQTVPLSELRDPQTDDVSHKRKSRMCAKNIMNKTCFPVDRSVWSNQNGWSSLVFARIWAAYQSVMQAISVDIIARATDRITMHPVVFAKDRLHRIWKCHHTKSTMAFWWLDKLKEKYERVIVSMFTHIYLQITIQITISIAIQK